MPLEKPTKVSTVLKRGTLGVRSRILKIVYSLLTVSWTRGYMILVVVATGSFSSSLVLLSTPLPHTSKIYMGASPCNLSEWRHHSERPFLDPSGLEVVTRFGPFGLVVVPPAGV